MAVNVVSLTKVEETVQIATYFGALEPNRSRSLGFTVPGKIKSIASRGQIVALNEFLAELDVNDLEEQKKSLQSQLAQLQNPQEFQQVQQKIDGLDEQIQARRITAPFDCVVEEVFAFENSLIGAQSPVMRILDSKKTGIKINLPTKVASLIDSDLEVYFLLDEKAVIGKLASKSETEKAGSINCWFDIQTDLTDVDYKFGQTVEARFNFQTGNSGFWLPLSALDRSGEGIWSVLMVEANNGKSVVSRKLVTIVQLTDDQALIDGDILEGAIAITDGIHRVVPGQEVATQMIQNGESSKGEEPSE